MNTIRKRTPTATTVKRLSTGTSGTGSRTIYLIRRPDAASGFYRLNVE